MKIPLAVYDLENNHVEYRATNLVWAAILDKRYKLEVHRTRPYHGTLFIFDSKLNDTLECQAEVPLAYDAKYGPDAGDIIAWQEAAIKFIDSTE